MSEVGRKISSAAQVVENSLAAAVKDLESGIGSFFSGGHAHTHEAAPVREASEDTKEKEAANDAMTQSGQLPATSQQPEAELDHGQGL